MAATLRYAVNEFAGSARADGALRSKTYTLILFISL